MNLTDERHQFSSKITNINIEAYTGESEKLIGMKGNMRW